MDTPMPWKCPGTLQRVLRAGECLTLITKRRISKATGGQGDYKATVKK